jgi:hypothetical protein
MIYLQIVLHAYLSFSLPVSSLHFFVTSGLNISTWLKPLKYVMLGKNFWPLRLNLIDWPSLQRNKFNFEIVLSVHVSKIEHQYLPQIILVGIC